MSRRSSDSQDTVVNSEEINYPKIQNDLDDWKLPKVSNQEIYKKGTFKFFTDYTIKTSEMTVSLEQDDQVIRLLDNRSVEKHKKDGYNFIHFGMIQVAAKPLTRLGLNTAIVMCLRDNRHLEYRDSIIGAVQAGLNDGPTHGFKIKPGNSPVSIITRFAYKSMNTSVGSGALCTSPKGETTYFHSDMLDNHAQRSESIEQIVQYPDGGGELVSPNLSDIPAALEFLFMNPLELQALPSQLEPLGKKKDPAQEILRTTVPKVIRTIYQEEFYAYLRQEKKNIKFWIWFELFKQEEYPDYPCAALNCLQEGLVPTQFYEKTRQALFGANDDQGIRTKLLDKEILFEFANPPGERSINTIKDQVIKAKQNHINLLKQEIAWKQHEVELPYEPDFSEKNIPTKARPIQMNKDLLSYCEKEIQDLMDKKLIRKSKSPWSCSAFYVQKQAELERGTPRLVINYKPLNDVLRWIRYPIPNKKDLLQRLGKSKVFSKFDMKSGFWQIQIAEKDRYKTAFVVPFGHYEWNVMPFGLKNAPSEFQNIMNEIFNQFSDFIIVYIDDVLIYSDSVEQHWKHLNRFIELLRSNGLSLSATKINLFQTKSKIPRSSYSPRNIHPHSKINEFADKFPDEIKDKKQLQRFLGSLNYVSDFIQDLSQLCPFKTKT
ncbi:polyprotein [Vitis vinifera]|uniref:Polyprotein n=1 Tax=Vitis vinifera TaxID=29760 RepID=A0A438I413_VITVI|nr:polyprotein [Vitis vinifera]